MPITPDQLDAFPHTRALFEHRKIQEFVQKHQDYDGNSFEALIREQSKHVDDLVPHYTVGTDTNNPIEAIEKGTAKCNNRAVILYAAAAQLPLLRTCLLVTNRHVSNAAYNPKTDQAAMTDNRSINIGNVRHGSIHSHFIKPDERTGEYLRNYEVARYLRSLSPNEEDVQIHMQYWNGPYNNTYASRERIPNRLTLDLGVRVGFAAVRFIERSFAWAEEAKKAVPTS